MKALARGAKARCEFRADAAVAFHLNEVPEATMFREKNRGLHWVGLVLLVVAIPLLGQTPARPAGQVPATGGGEKKSGVPQAPPAPQSKHYPILLIASGMNPVWSVRIGMKGAERLERAGYPPITLEPGEIAADDSGIAWTYKAKDTGTNAEVTVHLTREACSDGTDTKYSFQAVVTDAELGELRGCAKIAAEQFPEFKQKNLDEDDPEKKKVVPPITGFKAPVEIAFIDPTGKVTVARGTAAKVVAPEGNQLAFSHDGKRLLFTREDHGNERTILMYDVASGKTTEVMRGMVQNAFWSPDDTRIAFLRFADPAWTVWTMPTGSPDKAAQLSTSAVWALHGWVDTHTVLASSNTTLYFLKTESPPIAIPIRDVYGDGIDVTSSDTIRVNPSNPDLLLVTAAISHPKTGMPADAKTGLGGAAFLYELRSKRRVTVTPANVFAEDAEWSRDAIQIFFTNRESAKAVVICRVFWDGSGYKRVRGGRSMVVGQ
jgi:uncharacterized membrane protein